MTDKSTCTFVNDGGVCDQPRDHSVHTGWTDAQSGQTYPPLHEFTTEVVTTEKYRALLAKVGAQEREIARLRHLAEECVCHYNRDGIRDNECDFIAQETK